MLAEEGVPIESAGLGMERILEGLDQQMVTRHTLVELSRRNGIILYRWYEQEAITVQLAFLSDKLSLLGVRPI